MTINLKLYYLLAVLLGTSVLAQDPPAKKKQGDTCDRTRNRLNSETHKFSTECDGMTHCSAAGICEPKGCRRDEFPFGYPTNATLPAMCSSGQFCPDEEDQCLPIMDPPSVCQLNRDDQCAPPSDRTGLEGQENNHGAMCFQYTCQYANITLGQACQVENIVYIGYGGGGAQFTNIVSRDRCAPKLWCNAQSSVCEPVVTLGQACIAHKQCETYTCNTKNVCADPPGTPLKIQLWQYIVTGISIVVVMISTSVGLFMMHKRSRAKKLREIRDYFREQTSYRNSIINMHSNARSRISLYSLASSTHSRGESLSQFGALGRESIDEDEGDSDHHGLLAGRRSSEGGHREHEQDSDDEGVGYTHHPHGGTAPLARPISRLKEGWNPGEWGSRR